jgi:hypothetical protein
MSTADAEFSDVGHCGGKYTVTVKTTGDGRRAFQVGVSQSRPVPTAIMCIAADYDGNPIGIVSLGWTSNAEGQINEQQHIPVFLASDRTQKFGHECPRCKGYWRSSAAPHFWNPRCPYCGLSAETHHFRTEGQKKFIQKCCAQVTEAVNADKDGECTIDMDDIADEVSSGIKPPAFYYAETSQQNKFTCQSCGVFNDILGVYGYCFSCGCRNNLAVCNDEFEKLSVRLKEGAITPIECIKNTVSILDSAGVDYVSQLNAHVPMTPGRTRKTRSLKFHDLDYFTETLRMAFDIDLTKNADSSDLNFLKIIFQRRHVFEHNSAVVDQKYLDRSGDKSVKLGQAIRETTQNAERFVNLIASMVHRLHDGFHSILPLNEKAMKILRPKRTLT